MDERHLFWARISGIAGVLGVLVAVAIPLIASKGQQSSVAAVKDEARTVERAQALPEMASVVPESADPVSSEPEWRPTSSSARDISPDAFGETSKPPERRKPSAPAVDPTPLELEYRGE